MAARRSSTLSLPNGFGDRHHHLQEAYMRRFRERYPPVLLTP